MTDFQVRTSYLADAVAMGVVGAAPLVFKAVDVRDRPNHPENRFDLTLDWGTIVAVVGDENSGVGELGKYVMGLARPDDGAALVFGAAIADLDYYQKLVFRRRLGYLQTGDGLLQNLSLRGNLTLPLAYASDHRLAEVTGRVEELIEHFGLQHVADLRPAAANEEDRRRTAVARAVALDPELLVLEAPFDGLTARAARDLLERATTRSDGTPRTIFLTAQDLVPSLVPHIHRVVRLLGGLAVEDRP